MWSLDGEISEPILKDLVATCLISQTRPRDVSKATGATSASTRNPKPLAQGYDVFCQVAGKYDIPHRFQQKNRDAEGTAGLRSIFLPLISGICGVTLTVVLSAVQVTNTAGFTKNDDLFPSRKSLPPIRPSAHHRGSGIPITGAVTTMNFETFGP